MKQYTKSQNLKNAVTSRFVKSGIRSINGIKRKLTFANGKTPKTMGPQRSKNGFCHHETIYKKSEPQK